MSTLPPEEPRRPEAPPGSPQTGAAQDPAVPDDLRALEADVAAYHREQRQARRRERLSRLALTHTRYRLIAPVTAAGLLVVAAFVSSVVAFGRPLNGPARPGPAPLSSAAAPVGAPGGLLPELDVVVDGRPTPLRSVRPAVLLLVDDQCACGGVVHEITGSVVNRRVPLLLVATRDSRELEALASDKAAGNLYPDVAVDRSGRLERDFRDGVTDPVLVFVRADGTIDGAPLAVGPGARVEGRLDHLLGVQP